MVFRVFMVRRTISGSLTAYHCWLSAASSPSRFHATKHRLCCGCHERLMWSPPYNGMSRPCVGDSFLADLRQLSFVGPQIRYSRTRTFVEASWEAQSVHDL
ncbi:hypothetical protein DFH29DRAFT_170865 [Suillus ampliporus]|nr:hypothetical protein DFH29DRAFT_170865 [Suillus ampliporus]